LNTNRQYIICFSIVPGICFDSCVRVLFFAHYITYFQAQSYHTCVVLSSVILVLYILYNTFITYFAIPSIDNVMQVWYYYNCQEDMNTATF
jgi:antibiotic biosynthesis monooxygenase (ABM) superfamily enzyme